jgi:heptosyltransferase-2
MGFGRGETAMTDYRNILLIRTDRVGDVILTTPAVRAVRQIFPKAAVTMLVAAANASLVEGNPNIDRVMVDDRQGRHGGMMGFWRLVGEIHRQRFDLAVNFIPKKRTNLLCFLARVPRRVGYLNDKYGFLLSKKIPDTRHQGTMHEAEYCLELVKTLGAVTADVTPFLYVKPDDEAWAKDVLFRAGYAFSSSGIVAVHSGASCPTKRWPLPHFAELLKRITQSHNCRIVLVGGSETVSDSRDLSERLANQVLDMTGKTTLGRLAGLLRQCRLLISNDSGPVHMAAALGIPVVSIFTRNHPGINPQRWRPLGPRARVVAPELSGGNGQGNGTIKEIPPTVQAVWEAVDDLEKAGSLFQSKSGH